MILFPRRVVTAAKKMIRLWKVIMQIVTTHKWGWVATKEYCKKNNHHFHSHFHPDFLHTNFTADLIVARNVYEAIASGYMYHKRGAECWLNHEFSPNPYPHGGNDHMRHTQWWDLLSVTKEETKKYSNIINMCEVLVSLPDSIGIRVYAEFAYVQWYFDAYNYILRFPKVRIMCLNKLESIMTDQSGHNQNGQRLQKEKHSSHENFSSRNMHIQMAMQFDNASFGGKYRRLQQVVRCI